MPLTQHEKLAITKVARGQKLNPRYVLDRAEAVAAHRRVIREDGYLQSPEGRFMGEIDCPCPDLMLRAMYRKAILCGGSG